MELWNRFYDLLIQSVHFRSGFIWGVIITLLVGWLLSSISSYYHARWLRIRKFFEATKQPTKAATEAGPSPASALFSCLGNFLLLVLGAGLVIVLLLWQMNLLGQ